MTDFFSGASDHTPQNTDVDPFEALTGPGGKFDRSKYQSDDDLQKAMAKSIFHADSYIDHMKARQDELRTDYTSLREQYNAGPKLEELIDRLAHKEPHQNSNTPSANDEQAGLDLSKIEELVNSRLTQHEQKKKEDDNARKVEMKLIEKFGSSYQNTLKSQIDSLGMDQDLFNGLARKHPELVIKTLGLDVRQDNSFQTPPPSSQGHYAPSGNKRTNSYYQNLRKTDPIAYRSPKIQDQMYKDAVSLGDAFNDGDWNTLGVLN